MNATFFGSRKATANIAQKLETVLRHLILNYSLTNFYIGNQGNFDYIVLKTLKKLKQDCPQIKFTVVLAYMPKNHKEFDSEDYSYTIYPERLENSLKRFAIAKRNLWMIERSDFVITFIENPFGCSAKFKEIAAKNKKQIIEISEM